MWPWEAAPKRGTCGGARNAEPGTWLPARTRNLEPAVEPKTRNLEPAEPTRAHRQKAEPGPSAKKRNLEPGFRGTLSRVDWWTILSARGEHAIDRERGFTFARGFFQKSVKLKRDFCEVKKIRNSLVPSTGMDSCVVSIRSRCVLVGGCMVEQLPWCCSQECSRRVCCCWRRGIDIFRLQQR